jgi:hypothetical protein
MDRSRIELKRPSSTSNEMLVANQLAASECRAAVARRITFGELLVHEGTVRLREPRREQICW